MKDEDALAIKHKLVVTPAEPVDGGFTTVVEYAGIPASHTDADGSSEGWNTTDDGATFLNQPIGSMTGFPNNNTPADKATYTIDVDIPNTITTPPAPGARRRPAMASSSTGWPTVPIAPPGAGASLSRWPASSR